MNRTSEEEHDTLAAPHTFLHRLLRTTRHKCKARLCIDLTRTPERTGLPLRPNHNYNDNYYNNSFLKHRFKIVLKTPY
eukprot:COSAG06_NODE_18107_length_903_cov_26.370259_2_plen_78_part_00